MPAIVLVRPEIPQNVAAVVRVCACFGLELHIVGPLPFVLDMQRLRRITMDYIDLVQVKTYADFRQFQLVADGPLVATTPRATIAFTRYQFAKNSYVLFGSESVGLDNYALSVADASVRIPMVAGARSLNLAVSTGIVGAHLCSLNNMHN